MTAYAIDKDFPATLTALYDNDPARRNVIDNSVKENIESIRRSEDFQANGFEYTEESIAEDYPALLWNLLATYNAGSYIPNKKLDHVALLRMVSELGVNDCYPLVTFYLASLEAKSKQKDQVREKVRPIFESLLSSYELVLDLCQIDSRNSTPDIVRADNILVGQNQIEDAADFVGSILISKDVDELQIVDPYFSIGDLKFIGDSIQRDPNVSITILTSLFRMKKIESDSGQGVDDTVYEFWIQNINSQSVPSIKIIFIGLETSPEKMPIHDRWWLFDNEGLRFGGSVNGLGVMRVQEISKIDTQERVNIDQCVLGFLSAKQKTYEGERVKYKTVDI
ncbi:hypothetical protein [Teredinibacter turnerae]|uniref:hypothetical protein n=1 Tax=Teredinibacter turnerae TaxID=2426 RepID=UPI000406D935|nr:hypothetical protein [Teredinibacter turnerae]